MHTPTLTTAILAATVALTVALAGIATAETPTAGDGQHAPSGVKPGSHDDWCAEHAVPESLCTRCNTKLIPAFKATNDWCGEHGLPESQCTICNPDLKITRPPKSGGE